MDARPCRRREDTIVSGLPPLVDRSTDGSKVTSNGFKLPTELITHIFQLCGSDTRPRLTFTHTCRRWRYIAINHAPLWTSIFIQTKLRNPKARLNNFLSFLGMQLDRAASRPLDVTWIAQTGDEIFNATLKLLREKGPFFRWRTLRLEVNDGWHTKTPWSSEDAFTNLEFLQVLSWSENTLLDVIDRTVTSRFKVLNLRTSQVNVLGTFPKSLLHLSSIVLKHLSDTDDVAFLPVNVVHLQLDSAERHPLPHIRRYELSACTFGGIDSIDLRNLTTLIVRGPLTIQGQVLFPALRDLTLGCLQLHSKTEIEAPALDILYFTDENSKNVRLTSTEQAFQNPGYLLSPNTSIIADPHLPSTTLLALLAKSSKVTDATLRFSDWAGAQAVLERLRGFGKQTDPCSKDVELCPSLCELKLDFTWEFCAPSTSKEWISDRLKARREAGITPPLSVYACWKGEGRYMPITND